MWASNAGVYKSVGSEGGGNHNAMFIILGR